MPSEEKRSLADLRRIFGRRKAASAKSPGRQTPEPEPAVPSAALDSMTLQSLLRYARVVAAAADDLSELLATQLEVDRRLINAQQDADIASLQQAARQLGRRRLVLETGPEGDTGSDRLLGPSRFRQAPGDDDDRGGGVTCMCSLVPPPD
jgi:hypothetical protein